MELKYTPEPWDAIIVGAGPAGCAAAYDLATLGRRVLLVDRCDFPRSKACAGGLTMKTVRALRYPIDDVVREVVHTVVLEQNGASRTRVKTRSPICVMTVRSEFDAYCLRRTLAASAEFRRVPGVKSIHQDAGGITLDTGESHLRARYLVGADGVHSPVRRLCMQNSSAGGFAMEARVPLPKKAVDLTFDFGAVRNGYGWIFPKGDHLNIGLGYYGAGATDRLNRERLMEYIRRQVGSETAEHVVGQYLGVGDVDAPCAAGRVLLAGDAAGLVDPLTAEGIYSAVVSGQAAAKAIEAALAEGADPAAVQEHALRPLKATLRFSHRAARSFYASPDRGFRALRLPGLKTALMKTYAHGLDAGGGILRIVERWGSR